MTQDMLDAWLQCQQVGVGWVGSGGLVGLVGLGGLVGLVGFGGLVGLVGFGGGLVGWVRWWVG